MKGLFVKDLKLMMLQKNFLLLIRFSEFHCITFYSKHNQL